MPILTNKIESNRGFALIETGASAIANTTVETNLFTTTIPAGKMGSNKVLSFELTAHITTPALSIPTLTVKLKLGSYTLTLFTSTSLSANITDKPLIIEGKIVNMGTNSQFVIARVYNNSGGLLLSGLASSFSVTDGTWAVDTTVDQTMSITGQFGGLSATASIVTKIVEINLS